MDADRTNNAAISAIWNIDYFHRSSMFLKQALKRLADLADCLFD